MGLLCRKTQAANRKPQTANRKPQTANRTKNFYFLGLLLVLFGVTPGAMAQSGMGLTSCISKPGDFDANISFAVNPNPTYQTPPVTISWVPPASLNASGYNLVVSKDCGTSWQPLANNLNGTSWGGALNGASTFLVKLSPAACADSNLVGACKPEFESETRVIEMTGKANFTSKLFSSNLTWVVNPALTGTQTIEVWWRNPANGIWQKRTSYAAATQGSHPVTLDGQDTSFQIRGITSTGVPTFVSGIHHYGYDAYYGLPYIKVPRTLASAAIAGNTSVASRVSAQGAAELSVSIPLPANGAGFTPDVSIQYSSQRERYLADNNLPADALGYGWSLAAASTIRHCITGRSDRTSIALDANDSLCLDGKPLVLASGTHLQNGAVYRAETDSFSRVIYKNHASGNSGFEVHQPDGARHVYKMPDSNASQWMLSEVINSAGITDATYYYALSNQVPVLTSIEYAAGKIDFAYVTRSDAIASGYGFKTQRQSLLLHRISINDQEWLIDAKKDASNRMRVNAIQQCGYMNPNDINSRSCKEPVQINWNASNQVAEVIDGFGAATQITYSDSAQATFTEHPFDRSHVTPTASTTVSTQVVTALSTSNGLGGWNNLTFKYKGASNGQPYADNSTHRGFYGFLAQRVKNESSGIVSYRQYYLGFPYMGALRESASFDADFGAHTQTHSKSVINLSSRTTTHASGKQSRFPFASSITNYTYEGGTQLGASQIQTSYSWSSSGLPTQQIATQRTGTSPSGSGNSITIGSVLRAKKTTTQFENSDYLNSSNGTQGNNWVVGFVKSIADAHYEGDVTGTPTRTLTASYTKVPYTNKVASATAFPADADYELTRSFSYNAALQPESVSVSGVSIPSTTETMGWGNYGLLTQRTNALGHSEQFTYDLRFGRVSSKTDPNGQATAYTYGPLGQKTSFTNRHGTRTNFGYWNCSSYTQNTGKSCPVIEGVSAIYVESKTNPVKPTERTFFDQLGRTIRTEKAGFNGDPVYIDSAYDAQGRLSKTSNPYMDGEPVVWQAFSYDTLGRLVHTLQPDGGSTRVIYDADAATGTVKVTSVQQVLYANGSNAMQTQTQTELNLLGEVVSVTEGFGTGLAKTTRYQYDASGLLTQITAPGGLVTSMTYDQAGQRTQITDSDGVTVESRYTALNQLRWQQDGKGQITTWNYDELGRKTAQTDADGTVNWYYDPANKIGALGHRSNNKGFTETYAYNTEGLLNSITTRITVSGFSARMYSHHYGYDSYGRLSTQNYPSGFTVGYQYNSAGYQEVVESASGGAPLMTINAVDAANRPANISFGNGVASTRQFSSSGRLNRVSTYRGATSIQNNDYRWRSNGAMQERWSGGAASKREVFSYDAMNRLEGADTYLNNNLARSLDYGFNTAGQLATQNSSVAADQDVTSPVYNATGSRLNSVYLNGIKQVLSYDGNGNVTYVNAATGNDKFISWDAQNRASNIAVGTSQTGAGMVASDSFLYDPDGKPYYKRTVYKDAGVTRVDHTFYAGGFEDYLPANDPDFAAIQKVFVNKSVMHVQTRNHSSQTTNRLRYVHRDANNSVERVTDENGNIILTNAWDPHGQRRAADWSRQLNSTEVQSLFAAQGFSTARGFMDSETLDLTGVRTRGGRVYDVGLGIALEGWGYGYVTRSLSALSLSLFDPHENVVAGFWACQVAQMTPEEAQARCVAKYGPSAKAVYICTGKNDLYPCDYYLKTDNLSEKFESGKLKPVSDDGEVTCVEKARVLKGNRSHVGAVGGFPKLKIEAGDAAIIPRQWTGAKGAGPKLRNVSDRISGITQGGQIFTGLGDTVGNENYQNLAKQSGMIVNDPYSAQDAIVKVNDALIIELVTGEDEGAGETAITLPSDFVDEFGCPSSEYKAQP